MPRSSRTEVSASAFTIAACAYALNLPAVELQDSYTQVANSTTGNLRRARCLGGTSQARAGRSGCGMLSSRVWKHATPSAMLGWVLPVKVAEHVVQLGVGLLQHAWHLE